LQAFAKSRQTTVIDVLHSTIDVLEYQEFLRGLNERIDVMKERNPAPV